MGLFTRRKPTATVPCEDCGAPCTVTPGEFHHYCKKHEGARAKALQHKGG